MSAFTDYLDQSYTLKPAGSNQFQVVGPCPFCGHDALDQRMYINRQTGAGFCHHCGTGFGPARFIQAREQCDYKTALKILRSGASGGYVASQDDQDGAKQIEVPWPELVDVFAYHDARDYLNVRNVSDAMIKRFRLSYCVRNMNFDDKLYRTKGRVIIPIYGLDGKPVGWQGRDITGQSKIRYLFPPNFQAGDHLYNITSVDPALRYVILTEGAFHVFGWARFGVRNVLGTFGKKISDAQIDLLLTLGIKELLIAWDSDAHWERDEFCQKWGHLFKIMIVDLGGKDSDESSYDELKNALAGTRAFDWTQKILACL